jgi:hypothetical protein
MTLLRKLVWLLWLNVHPCRLRWAIKRICYTPVQVGSGLVEWAGVAYGCDNVADCLAGCGGVGFVGEE